ncbi:hypothetical protein B0O99DRAFT_15921 [Bisporella sp. PMI_857]|nr:hypothetical protein B0O99DRAFT_15921 [Bisporella sp. PMI_857]
MMRRGGWSSNILRAPRTIPSLDGLSTANKEWLMSKRLSRECALGPDWVGNGLEQGQRRKQAFGLVSTINFTELSTHYPGFYTAGTIFTVSGCGKFLLTSNDCLIHVYEINRSHQRHGVASRAGCLRPITSIICPRRVLACSMDTSSQRYAVAALLEGRMGLVCDITSANSYPIEACNVNPGSSKPGIGLVCRTRTSVNQVHDAEECPPGPSFLEKVSFNSSSSIIATGTDKPATPFVFPGAVLVLVKASII